MPVFINLSHTRLYAGRIKEYILCICIFIFCVFPAAQSQQVNTHAFIENSPVRHILNPAFQTSDNWYIGIPFLGYLQFGVANNSLTVKDFAYTDQGKTITALHPDGDKDKFYDRLRKNTLIALIGQVSLINFGFRTGKIHYWNFTLSEKVEGYFSLPKDIFKLLLYGTPDIPNSHYDLRRLEANVMAYTEAAFGYARDIDKYLTVGGKVKFLIGTAHGSFSNKELALDAGIDRWLLTGNGQMDLSSPYMVEIADNLDSITATSPDNFSDWVKPSGFGAGIDIGAVYRTDGPFTFSASLLDIGLISWKRNVKNVEYEVDYSFEGFEFDDLGDINFDSFVDTIGDAIKNAVVNRQTEKNYLSLTSPKLMLSAEYRLTDQISFGLLSRTVIRKRPYEEIIVSVNGKPLDWLNASLSYSVLNGKFSTIGIGVGIRVPGFHFFVATDYFSFSYAKYNNIPVPYKSKGVNFALGMNLLLGGNRTKSNYKCYGIGNEHMMIGR